MTVGEKLGDQLSQQNPAYGPLVPRQLRLARIFCGMMAASLRGKHKWHVHGGCSA
jgi:hypothetical protein